MKSFVAARAAVAKAAGYSEKLLSGDGLPFRDERHVSFSFSGRGKDSFTCEIYADGTYKVKAALNGEYPFKYIAEGKF